VAQKVSLLMGKLAVARQAQDMTMMTLPGLVDKVANANRQREKAEGQCEALAEELTLLRIRESELFLTVVSAPQRGCHTPFRDRGNEASIRVPRMFHSHV
jgi:hypothetical protein